MVPITLSSKRENGRNVISRSRTFRLLFVTMSHVDLDLQNNIYIFSEVLYDYIPFYLTSLSPNTRTSTIDDSPTTSTRTTDLNIV